VLVRELVPGRVLEPARVLGQELALGQGRELARVLGQELVRGRCWCGTSSHQPTQQYHHHNKRKYTSFLHFLLLKHYNQSKQEISSFESFHLPCPIFDDSTMPTT
jgi:hypothetical protein